MMDLDDLKASMEQECELLGGDFGLEDALRCIDANAEDIKAGMRPKLRFVFQDHGEEGKEYLWVTKSDKPIWKQEGWMGIPDCQAFAESLGMQPEFIED